MSRDVISTHDCFICGYTTSYIKQNGIWYYDASCKCGKATLEEVDSKEINEFLRMKK